MNPQYIETFRRHRILFLLPVVLAMALAVWATLGTPKMYRSSTSLWSDTAGGSAAEVIGATPPAAQDQSMLNELLTTRYFVHNVARLSPLQRYLESHPSEGWGPTALLEKVRASKTLDDRIAAALSPKRVTTTVRGPHVLQINYDASSPTLAVATLRVLVQQFRKQRAVLRRDALTAAQEQVVAASKALAEARTHVGDYVREHPGASGSDPALRSLIAAEREAVTGLANATESMNQASTALLNGASFETTLRVVDPPRLPIGPSTGKKHLVMVTFAGLFAGVLISILGIVLLTKTTQALRPVEEGFARDDATTANGSGAVLAEDRRVSAEPSGEQRARSEETHFE